MSDLGSRRRPVRPPEVERAYANLAAAALSLFTALVLLILVGGFPFVVFVLVAAVFGARFLSATG